MIEWLPDEVVILVLEWLPARDLLRARRVCRRLHALVARRLLVLRAPGDELLVTSALFALLVVTRPPAPRLALHLAHRLRYLTLHATAPLDDHDLLALHELRHLEHLDAFTCARTVDNRLIRVASRLQSLVVNEHVSSGVLRALGKRSDSLRALHMFGRSLHYSSRDLNSFLALRGAHLRELTLRCNELHDRHYSAISECENLQSLQLYSCWMLRKEGAMRLAKLTMLRRLHITGARMLRPRSLDEFLRHLTCELHELDLSATWFGDEHVESVGSQHRLRVLEAWRTRVTSQGVATLVAALPALRILDVDVSLPASLAQELQFHPSLERLRCRIEQEQQTQDISYNNMRVLMPTADRGQVSQRGGGEGYLGEVYYYWAQHDVLEPLAVAWRMPLVVCQYNRHSCELSCKDDCDR